MGKRVPYLARMEESAPPSQYSSSTTSAEPGSSIPKLRPRHPAQDALCLKRNVHHHAMKKETGHAKRGGCRVACALLAFCMHAACVLRALCSAPRTFLDNLAARHHIRVLQRADRLQLPAATSRQDPHLSTAAPQHPAFLSARRVCVWHTAFCVWHTFLFSFFLAHGVSSSFSWHAIR
eukprot:3941402-Rhodomonas_salina.1